MITQSLIPYSLSLSLSFSLSLSLLLILSISPLIHSLTYCRTLSIIFTKSLIAQSFTAVFLVVQSSRKGSLNAKFPLKMFLKLETKFLDSIYDQIARLSLRYLQRYLKDKVLPLRVIKKSKLDIAGNLIIQSLPKLLLWTQ